jgi:hypothetical protein
MKAQDLKVEALPVEDAQACLRALDPQEEATAECVIKTLFSEFRELRAHVRALDGLLLASEAELPEHLRQMGIDCSDEEVLDLIDTYGRTYCW